MIRCLGHHMVSLFFDMFYDFLSHIIGLISFDHTDVYGGCGRGRNDGSGLVSYPSAPDPVDIDGWVLDGFQQTVPVLFGLGKAVVLFDFFFIGGDGLEGFLFCFCERDDRVIKLFDFHPAVGISHGS